MVSFPYKIFICERLERRGRSKVNAALSKVENRCFESRTAWSQKFITFKVFTANRAAVALISVGKNNQSKQPSQDTIERFAQLPAKVYRTDEQGQLNFQGGQTGD